MTHARNETKRTGSSASGKRSTRTRKATGRKTTKTTKTTRARGGKRPAKGPKRPTTAPRGKVSRDPRLPAPGTTLTRTYKGRELRLEVLAEGFRFEGETFRSLTAAALRATGYKAISGPHFWRIGADASGRASGKEGTAD